MARDEVLRRLEETKNTGCIILGASAGMGLSAKVENKANVDFITCSGENYFTVQGRGEKIDFLPVCDMNELVCSLAPEIISMAGETPVFAGVFANDTFRDMSRYLEWLKDAGFDGVLNSPSMEEVDGYARKVHESVHINYENEVQLIKKARQAGMYAVGVCYNRKNAVDMVDAGADMVLAKVVSTTELALLEDKEEQLKRIASQLQEIIDGALSRNSQTTVLADCRLLEEREDLEYILSRTTGLSGYHGTVTIEGYHVRKAIRDQIAAFKTISY